MASQDDDRAFGVRLEAAREFIRAGAQVKEVEIHALLSSAPLERIPGWMRLFKEDGVDLGMVSASLDEKLVAGKAKNVKVAPLDPDRVAMAISWLAQETICSIRKQSHAP